MFGLLKPRLPVNEEQREWVDRSFVRLASLLGSDRMLNAIAMTPTPQHFPDPWDESEAALRRMFQRIAKVMQVDPDSIDLELFETGYETTRSLVPFWSGKDHTMAPGGLYQHAAERTYVGIDHAKLKDPLALVAVLAHELGHVILLRPGLVGHDEPDMEPLNDLLTVFLGFGIFNANASFQFKQFSNDRTQGWSTNTLGYLPQEIFAYALARFAYERGEAKPAWAAHLSTNIGAYFKQSFAWLSYNKQPRLFAQVGMPE